MRASRAVMWLLGGLAAASAWGQVGPTHYQLSPDIPVAVTSGGTMDADILDLDVGTGGFSALHALSAILPAGTGIDAVTCFANGDVVFSTDTAFSWGAGSAGDEDLVVLAGGTMSLFFDGSAAGIPAGVGIDAVHVISLSPVEFYFSIDTDAAFASTSFTDDDVIHYDGSTSSFSLATAGSTWLGSEQGRAEVDGLALFPGESDFYVSLDVSVNLAGGGSADDDDVLLVSSGSTSVALDLSSLGFPGPGSDVDGLDVQAPPSMGSGSVSYQIVNTATPATWTAVYTDPDNDPPAAGSPWVDIDSGGGTAMSRDSGCGTQCDGVFWNGERYSHTGTVAYGASHSYVFGATDGVDAFSSSSVSGPFWVSTPGDADGDTDHDARDLAIILIEIHDTNGGPDLDLVRGGLFTASWGGTDADSDHQIGPSDISAAAGALF